MDSSVQCCTRVAQNTKKYENQKCPTFLWMYGPNREENSKRLHSFDQNLARSLKVIFVFETRIYVLPTIVIASMLKRLGSWKCHFFIYTPISCHRFLLRLGRRLRLWLFLKQDIFFWKSRSIFHLYVIIFPKLALNYEK